MPSARDCADRLREQAYKTLSRKSGIWKRSCRRLAVCFQRKSGRA